MKKKYDEVSVVRSLYKKNGVYVNSQFKTIIVLNTATDVGNGSWGKIDYLVHYRGYTVMRTNTPPSGVITKPVIVRDTNDSVVSKAQKRENKLNMAAMAKSSMRRAKTKSALK